MKCFYSALLCFVLSIGNAQVSCISQLNLSLDTEGRASLTPASLLVSVPEPGFTYSISPNRIYTCADIGAPQYVTVTRSTLSGDFVGSCTTLVMVEDKIPRLPLTVSVVPASVNLGFGRTRTLTPEMFLVGSPCLGCLYTITPSSISCTDVGAPVNVSISVRDQFCQETTVTTTVTTLAGLGCSMRMSFVPFWINRSYLPGGNLPFFIELEQLTKKPNFKQVYAHFYISKEKTFDIKNSIYVGNEKLNFNQKQKKSSIQLPQQVNGGYYYLIGVLTDSPKIGIPDPNSNFNTMEFLVKSSDQALVSTATSLSSRGQQIYIDGFEGGEVRVYNINGSLLKSLQLNEGDPLNLEGINKGILIIQTIAKSGEVSTNKYLNP
jgi:hypothetical protein